MEKKTMLKFGMVGGGPGAFIGAVHRRAALFDGMATFTAGCFSRDPEKNKAAAVDFCIEEDRLYSDFRTMAAEEAKREDGIDFVIIVTPNISHYDAAMAFIEAGINVVCEKPLCCEVWQAEKLKEAADAKGVMFAVTYGYSGYVMVKQARQLILAGEIGKIINVNAEYLQEWLVDDVGKSDDAMVKLSAWRKDPDAAGISNCVGDIGSHIENTVSYMTGMRVRRLAAKLDRFGQPLDLNANILVELENGASGVFCCSQVCVGHMNGLVVRIYGTEGAIEWVQENPNVLYVTKKGQPMQTWHRGMGYVTGHAAELSRIPSGHPEGLYVGFANIYQTFEKALLKKLQGGTPEGDELDFPSIDDGVEGVRFIHAAVKSGNSDAAWVEI